MNNMFVELGQIPAVDRTSDPMARKLDEDVHKQRRDALYAQYTPMVNYILDQLIAALQPGVWKKGSDCDHKYSCHCRWYAGPAETGHAHYGGHAIRRRIEIELKMDDQCTPTGFKVHYYDNRGNYVHTGLSQDELVQGIKLVFE